MSTHEQQSAAHKTCYEVWAENENRLFKKASELMKGQSPYFNLVPVVQLLRDAEKFDLEVTARTSTGKSE